MKGRQFQLWLIAHLRRIHYRWPARNEATNLSKVSRGKYKCAECEEVFGPKEIQRDHIEPVQNVDGFDGWDALIDRLFCPVDGYQILCKPCHHAKSAEENKERRWTGSKRKSTK